jgi:hypothetical protein
MVDLGKFAAITQQQEKESLSDKYTFIPTTRVIDVMESKGWVPVRAQQAYAKAANQGFQKHMVRFRQEGVQSVLALDKVFPEIVVTNAHNGLSSFVIMAGLFRLVCLNGMVVADSTFHKHIIKHLGYADALVLAAIDQIADTTPRIASRVRDFDQIELTKDEQGIYAMAALTVKYGEEGAGERKFSPEHLIQPIRRDDNRPTLWATYNQVQEKLLKGGRFEQNPKPGRRMVKSRPVTSVTEDVRINQGLWLLAEELAKHKGMSVAA